jgi:hypothetical protein
MFNDVKLSSLKNVTERTSLLFNLRNLIEYSRKLGANTFCGGMKIWRKTRQSNKKRESLWTS